MSSPLALSTNHDLAPPRDTGSPDFEFLLNSKGTDRPIALEMRQLSQTDLTEENRSTET
jgi:hypothetical protein